MVLLSNPPSPLLACEPAGGEIWEVDFERVISMILNTSHLTLLVLLYSSTSRYPHPAIRSTPCEVHPGAGGTFLNILFSPTGTYKISLQHMFNTVV